MNKKTEAKCIGSMLTVGFHGANPPLIWRFDLERNHSFTLSLQGETGDWELGVTSPKGDFYPVVHFAGREEAEEAFAKVEKILSRSRGPASLVLKALAILGVLAIVVAAGVVLFGMSVNRAVDKWASPIGAQLHQPMPDGVPVPADQILTPPPQ